MKYLKLSSFLRPVVRNQPTNKFQRSGTCLLSSRKFTESIDTTTNQNNESNTKYNVNLLYQRIASLNNPIIPTYRVIYPMVC